MAASKKDYFYVGIQLLLFAAYVFEVPGLKLNLPSSANLANLILAGVGIILIVIALLQLNRNLSPFPTPRKDASLVTSGLFKYVRHPVYSGILMTSFFLAMHFHSGYKLFIFLLLLLLFYKKSRFEDKKLINKFRGYEKYKAETGRFFPKI